MLVPSSTSSHPSGSLSPLEAKDASALLSAGRAIPFVKSIEQFHRQRLRLATIVRRLYQHGGKDE